MQTVITVALAVTTAISAAGWLVNKTTTATLLWYLQEKGYPFPTNEEMKRGSRYVVEHMARDLFGR